MILVYRFAVHGQPAPQGSKRPVTNRRTGRIHLIEMSKRVKPWRQQVQDAAEIARNGADPLDGLLAADMVFSMPRPKSHYRTGRNAHLLRPDAPARPQGMPDLDKLLRSTGDALKTASLYVDDSRIVEYGRAAKVWAGSDDPDAITVPGAVIRVYRIGAGAAAPDLLDTLTGVP